MFSIATLVFGAVIIMVSRRGEITRAEALYRMRLHRTPALGYDSGKTKTTLLAAVFLVVYGRIMPIVMMNLYVIPYQQGAGQLLADGSVNWASGKTILTLSFAALCIPLGLISGFMIWRRYSPAAKTPARSRVQVETHDG
ncbi:MAG: hypothetical protein GY732_01690 [Gammaproteobacteria bacterium]|nr:hypothetical protein [Gammaproteobacteria bacterium]